MQYSNEAIELIESVLSESERWQYRLDNIIKKDLNKIDKQIENEERKINDFGKQDRSKLRELKDKRSSITHLPVGKDITERYRSGKVGDNLVQPKTNKDGSISWDELERMTKDHTPMHERINKRTQKYDTTHLHDVKKEAAMILIEALNTLLNE